MTTSFHRAMNAIEWLEVELGGLLLMCAAILVTGQIVARNFGISISGIYEIATFCTIWSVFLTAGPGIKRNIHVRVDVLLRILPRPIAFVLDILGMLLVIMLAAVLTYSGILLVDESLAFGDSTLGIIRVPMWIPQIIMPLGGLMMCSHAIRRLAKVICSGARNFDVDSDTDNLGI
ncbi:TRAP transporter small permease [Alcaligenaceae bacterium CGII-47]|nr:TRAP transporter small permease [Alcaligenaceae bacterium CGII-47]